MIIKDHPTYSVAAPMLNVKAKLNYNLFPKSGL